VNILGGLPLFFFSVFIAFSPCFFLFGNSRFFDRCTVIFGAWGVPNKHLYFCPFAAQNTMLAIFLALSCVFRLSIFLSAQAFAVYQRISRQSFVGDFCFFQ
jgi:hypothetical protein